MAIDRDKLLNWPFEDTIQTYGFKDVILYALGVGLGADPVDRQQLNYVYEKNLSVLPTFPVVLGHPGPWNANPESGIDRKKVVHGEQTVEIHRPFPVSATVRGVNRIKDVIDKGEGKGALVYTERKIYDESTGELLATLNATSFCRANGGFGGPSGPVVKPHTLPDRKPDHQIELSSIPQAALLYRLNVDYNPLHIDLDVAAAAGFKQPILHGLCSFGMAAHAILKAVCNYDATRLKKITTRFSSPVYPGEKIMFDIWQDGDQVSYRASVVDRAVKVLDNGYAELRSAQ
ncbi:MAG TPA: MaoC/PaaZ C-terminal domain-containing protein [Eoetvoesiella sp.]